MVVRIDAPLTNNLFINYESILNENLVYFHLKYAVGVQVSFILSSFNNFGFRKKIIHSSGGNSQINFYIIAINLMVF